MGKKIRVGILFGGRSAEHEVSIQSAKNVYQAIDREKYEPILIGIDRQGKWMLQDSAIFSLPAYQQEVKAYKDAHTQLSIDPGAKYSQLIPLDAQESLQAPIDVIFPVVHGTYGEDGTMQGLLKLLNLPFVGASVLGSAIGMDKDVMKKLLKAENLPIAKFLMYQDFEKQKIDFDLVKKELGMPVFIKPANMGSSVGVNKAKNEEEFRKAVEEAFEFDRKIIIEEFIDCEEIECSVLGNEDPVASLPGRIIPKHEFYSYEAKYLDESGAVLEIPAQLSEEEIKNVQELSINAFKALYCEGMARVDFFMDKRTRKLYVNEINTIPGFTRISMYPQLWEASGVTYTELIDKLIQLSLERFESEKKLKTSRTDG